MYEVGVSASNSKINYTCGYDQGFSRQPSQNIEVITSHHTLFL